MGSRSRSHGTTGPHSWGILAVGRAAELFAAVRAEIRDRQDLGEPEGALELSVPPSPPRRQGEDPLARRYRHQDPDGCLHGTPQLNRSHQRESDPSRVDVQTAAPAT